MQLAFPIDVTPRVKAALRANGISREQFVEMLLKHAERPDSSVRHAGRPLYDFYQHFTELPLFDGTVLIVETYDPMEPAEKKFRKTMVWVKPSDILT